METKKKKIKGAGRKCSICKNENLVEINEMIESGKYSFRHISSHFFDSISRRDAIRRHAGNCINNQIVMDAPKIQSGAKLKSTAKTAANAPPLKKKDDNIDVKSKQPVTAPLENIIVSGTPKRLNIFQRIMMRKRTSRLCAEYQKESR